MFRDSFRNLQFVLEISRITGILRRDFVPGVLTKCEQQKSVVEHLVIFKVNSWVSFCGSSKHQIHSPEKFTVKFSQRSHRSRDSAGSLSGAARHGVEECC